jgi:hypothetical protein
LGDVLGGKFNPFYHRALYQILMTDFYATLSPLEKTYWHKLDEVFAQVSPQKPEKGLRTIIQRARKEVLKTGEDLELVLEQHFQSVKERTERRIALINECSTVHDKST